MLLFANMHIVLMEVQWMCDYALMTRLALEGYYLIAQTRQSAYDNVKNNFTEVLGDFYEG